LLEVSVSFNLLSNKLESPNMGLIQWMAFIYTGQHRKYMDIHPCLKWDTSQWSWWWRLHLTSHGHCD